MNWNPLDRSNYFKALLILIGMDKRLSIEEKKKFRQIGVLLGFDKKFTEEAMNNLFDNEHIIYAPPKFSNSIIAANCVKVGIHLASTDKNLCQTELNWLRSIARKNILSKEWFNSELNNCRKQNNISDSDFLFEIDELFAL